MPLNSFKLPDQLKADLRVVFAGTAASRKSAELGAYYAHPGNRFWSALFEVGLTPRLFAPNEFRELLALGLGFTDLCKSTAGSDKDIHVQQSDIDNFRAKINEYRPRAIAFTSKNAARFFLGRPTSQIALGKQESRADMPELFVLASPSGAAASHWDISSWRALAAWVANL